MNDSSSNQQLNQILTAQAPVVDAEKKINRALILIPSKKIKNAFLRTLVEEMRSKNIPYELIVNLLLEIDEEVEINDIDEEKLLTYLSKY